MNCWNFKLILFPLLGVTANLSNFLQPETTFSFKEIISFTPKNIKVSLISDEKY